MTFYCSPIMEFSKSKCAGACIKVKCSDDLAMVYLNETWKTEKPFLSALFAVYESAVHEVPSQTCIIIRKEK